MAKAVNVTVSDVSRALNAYGGEFGRQAARNPQILAHTFEILRELAERKFAGAAADVMSNADSVSPSTYAKSASFTVSTLQLSQGLTALSSFDSPGAALSYLGGTFVAKTGLAMQFVGDDKNRAACAGAIMTLAGNVVVTTLTFETGIGAVLGLAAIAASAYSAGVQCAAATAN